MRRPLLWQHLLHKSTSAEKLSSEGSQFTCLLRGRVLALLRGLAAASSRHSSEVLLYSSYLALLALLVQNLEEIAPPPL